MSEVLIAKERIYLDGVLAHDVGHEVPASNVKAHGWGDLVAPAGSKTASKSTSAASAPSS